jgi:hypothetical protein
MRERIEREHQLLKKYYPDIIIKEADGSCWFRIPGFLISGDAWNKTHADVCFEAKVSYPGTPPYSFYVEGGLRSKENKDLRPKDYEEPAKAPFDGTWGRFSWQHEAWNPAENLVSGSNLLNFVRSFADRLKEGI